MRNTRDVDQMPGLSGLLGALGPASQRRRDAPFTGYWSDKAKRSSNTGQPRRLRKHKRKRRS